MIAVTLIVGIFAGYYISLDTHTRQLDSLDKRVEGFSEKISKIESVLSELKGQNSDISIKISELESSLSNVKSRSDEATSQIKRDQNVLQEEIEDIAADISKLQNEIEGLSQVELSQTALSEQLTDISIDISELASNISALETRIEGKTADMIFEEVAGSVVSVRVSVMLDGTVWQAQGSGFVFSNEGYIVTNNHVVEGFEEDLGIEVVFMDGTIIRGDFAASDPENDLAVLIVTLPEGVESLSLGDSSKIKVGEPVIAIGNPFGLGSSLTTGIVSQTHRSLTTDSGYLIPSVIQIDAAINPGNSGGPLLNYEGEVIGVTTAGISKLIGEGIGFAIPSNTVKRVVQSLIDKGEYIHPWTGIQGIELDLQIVEAMNLNTTKGVLIVNVVENSPAEAAGLREGNQTTTIFDQPLKIGGDVIIQVDDVEIGTFEDLVSYVDENKGPGDTINITVLRHGAKVTIPLTLGERPLASQYPAYVNVKIDVFDDQTTILDVSYRPAGGDRIWESIKNRPHWDILLGVTTSMVEEMLNMTEHEVISKEITENDFWQDEGWHSGGGWLIRVHVNLTESPNWQKNGDAFKLTIHDPWKPFGFLDAVNITSTGFSIIGYGYTPASATDITTGNAQEGYLLWLNTQFKESPETYIIKFK